MQDTERFRRFLSVLAHFSAIRPSQEYLVHLREDQARRDEPWGGRIADGPRVLRQLWEHAVAGDLGRPVKQLCSAEARRLDSLCGLSGELLEYVRYLETGLVHNDCYPDCPAGYRRETGELLLFDLADVELGPRFYDIAAWLGAVGGVQLSYASREELARFYLSEYARWGGNAPSLSQFLEESRRLWQGAVLAMLRWYLSEALTGPRDRSKQRDQAHIRNCCEQLHRYLSILLREWTK